MDKNAIRQISIIGVGLIGGSLGLASKKFHPEISIKGFDRNKITLEKAQNIGAIDFAAGNIAEAVWGSDIVVFAVPVRSIVSALKEAASSIDENAIITDVGSTKSEIIDTAKNLLGIKFGSFIGGHPMTGSEVTGIDGATADLFGSCYYVLTPTKETDSKKYGKLHYFLNSLGAKVIALDYEKHDKIMSLISHLPHAVSAALVNTVGLNAEKMENLTLLAAGGFRDMTRIASSSPDIWVDIFSTNAKMVISAVDSFIESLNKFKAALASGDEKEIKQFLAAAKKIKANIQGLLAKEEEIHFLRVLIPDKPGAISNVTVAIGAKGINIEDMQMIHLEKDRAVLECMIVGKDKVKKAAEEIGKLGYKTQIIRGIAE